MPAMKAVKQRIFVKDDDGYKLVPFCGFDFFDTRLKIVDLDISDKDIPPEFNTIFPQDVFLVFQDSECDEEFFDESKPGLVLTIKGFRLIREEQPFILMLNKNTGEVSTPNPEFHVEYYDLIRTVGGDT